MQPSSSAAAATSSSTTGLTGTAVTLAGFLGLSLLLSALPGVPAALRPLDLAEPEAREAAFARLTRRPKTTLVEHEKKLEGHVDEPKDVDDSAIAAEDAELHNESNGAVDVAILGAVDVEAAPPAAEADEDRPAVDRGAVAARAIKRSIQRRGDRSREKHKLMAMPGAAIENPCVATSAGVCVRTALDPFFATLDALARGEDEARAGVVIFGNSLIASDHVTDIVRDELQGRFGDGGRGYLLVDRLSKVAGRRVRTGVGSDGWTIRSFAQDPPFPAGVRFGFAGSLHESSVNGDQATWSLERATRARLSWLDTGVGMRLSVDGVEVLRVPRAPLGTTPSGAAKSIEVKLPPLGKELRLVADKGARVFGVAVERDVAGVVVDTIGVPAASARLYVDSTEADIFVEQLAQRDPALVTLMLGGNETRGIAYGNITAAVFEAKLNLMLDRVRRAAPQAACMIVTPIDAAKTTTGSEELTTREEIVAVIEVEKRVAAARGCALFDLWKAMGGNGSLSRMRDAGFVSEDLVHPTARGGDVLGQLFADAIVRSWVETPAPETPTVFRRHKEGGDQPRYAGLSFPEEERVVAVVVGEEPVAPPPPPLSRFFTKLAALERGDRTRVAIGQFGASHTAGQMFTDRIRDRLAARFGSLGRGFVSVGKASNRLAPSGVFRELIGSAEVADGREVVLGGALGMSGTKTRLLPGARFRVGFCQGCPTTVADPGSPSEENGRLQLAWLYTPDMGTADVLVDGVNVATLSPQTHRSESDVQFLSLPVTRERATLEVVSRKEPMPMRNDTVLAGAVGADSDALRTSTVGPVHLLSVTEEMDRKGIVLDAIGLPGTTGMTPQRWRQDLYAEEVKARRYDLIVTAWGTNEAGIASLDEATYRHHFGATLKTLRDAAPDADCLIIGASDRFDEKGGVFVQAPNHELVERVQRSLAAEQGCAFYSLRQAMGGAGSMNQWVKDGLGNPDHVHFTRPGYQKLADAFVDDLLLAWQHARSANAGDIASAEANSSDESADDVADPVDGAVATPALPKAEN